MGDVFQGCVFCLGGRYSMTRAALTKLIAQNGGTVSSSTTKKTTHLLCTDDELRAVTAKVAKAQNYGVPILGYDFLHDSIKDGSLRNTDDYLLTAMQVEDEDEEPPKRASRKRAPEPKKPAKRTTRRRVSKEESDDEDEEDDGVTTTTTTTSRRPSRRAAANATKGMRAAADSDYDDDDDEASDDDVQLPIAAPRKTSARTARKTKAAPVEEEGEVKKKLVKKGKCVVDSVCPKASTSHVLEEGTTRWQVMLNQTNIGNNNNKFYVIELLESDDGKKYYVWNRWGRVGARGQSKLMEATLSEAKRLFESKYRDKTGNRWADREDFVKKSGKYFPLEIDYGDDAEEEEEESASESEEEPVVEVKKKLVKKGRCVVDSVCPKASTSHVLEEGSTKWQVMLNQTNIGNNNNKFYVIELLESDDGKKYYVWNRWGRVGARGQSKLMEASPVEAAKRLFESKYYEKTRNRWADRENFVKVSGKYFPLEIDYSGGDEEEEEEAKAMVKRARKEQGKTPESTLHERIQMFITLIANLDLMKRTMSEMEIDVNKFPLGKLSKRHIQQGYSVLKQIEAIMSGSVRNRASVLMELSNEFYTLIPHCFGMRRPPVLNNPDLLQKKKEMIEALGDIEIAQRILKDARKGPMANPIDQKYGALNCAMTVLSRDDPKWGLLENFVQRTHAPTHSSYRLEVEDIFEIVRPGERERYAPYASMHNKMLLWHGSRLTNWMGILSQGLRIAPPEAPATGYMFGKGIYFADMASKSANYCFTNPTDNTGVMILCEVALGDMYELLHAEYMDQPPAGKNSTWGRGRTIPDPSEHTAIDDNVLVPCGKPMQSTEVQHSSLLYNEFIVYDVAQCMIRYLFRLKFHYGARRGGW